MDPVPPSPICVDASLAGAILLPDEASPVATRHWGTWIAQERRLLAPAHFCTEVASAIRRAAVGGRISPEAAERALAQLANQILRDTQAPEMTIATWRRAWEWAQKLRRSNLYDALYLAVAEEAGAELWTTDENLVRALEAHGQPAPAWVHLLTV